MSISYWNFKSNAIAQPFQRDHFVLKNQVYNYILNPWIYNSLQNFDSYFGHFKNTLQVTCVLLMILLRLKYFIIDTIPCVGDATKLWLGSSINVCILLSLSRPKFFISYITIFWSWFVSKDSSHEHNYGRFYSIVSSKVSISTATGILEVSSLWCHEIL